MGFDLLIRAGSIWLLIIVAEIIHGVARVRLLEPRIGDRRARQVAVFSGSIIVLVIAAITTPWLNPASEVAAFVVGMGWVVATVAFELLLGRYVIGMSWPRLLADFNLARGGLMPIGLLVMLLAPWIAQRWFHGL
ncbi:MAG: hypothetical protein GVY36_18560 [Verrucomicrobia bacterium]|jgi:hypothetical protein|nr:hypothetical protein [Verrucomicrobiota bacterium]